MKIIQTMHRSLGRAARRPAAAVLTVAAVVLISSWSCKSPTSPSGGEADIIVLSHWSERVDVFMDGAFKFPLGYKESAEIDNVSRITHLLEARSQVTGEVVAQKELEVTENTDYTWTIEHRARINCSNSFGETLKFFMDGVFLFDLADRENRWLIDVALGDHFLAAYKASDGRQAASITIKVTEDTDYRWAISMIEGSFPVVITGR
jgi:hypothetical protein